MADAIALEGLERRFGDRPALRGVSVRVGEGQTLAVFGANGAGKTTLLRVLATLLRPHAGSVSVLGASLPAPDRLALRGAQGLPRGKSGRALAAWLTRDATKEDSGPSTWRRLPIARGVELHVDADHPLARLGADDTGVAEAVRQAIAKLLPNLPT